MWIDRAITGKITNEKGGETKQPKMFGKKNPATYFLLGKRKACSCTNTS